MCSGENNVYDYDKPLDTDRMKKAAAYLLGEHDF